ncbi:M15 family metallopeptidase [Streptomyces sp. C10-9-1]|uniref:M15 family metallopeptidase n=1 Tax=Streptomyces sp. C10-9-1 TaxID=1859285 RepID=UPI003D728247
MTDHQGAGGPGGGGRRAGGGGASRRLLRRAAGALLGLAALAAATAGPAGAAGRAGTAPELVALRAVAPSVVQEIRYASRENFVGEPVDGYRAPLCLLTAPAARALARAQRSLLRQGYTLKVYDCYRPQRAVDHFVRWAADLGDQRTKAVYYPRVDKSSLFGQGYLAERSGHSRGSTVDATLVRRAAGGRGGDGAPEACHARREGTAADGSVDMGTAYDCFDPLSATDAPGVTPRQRAERRRLRGALEGVGFANLPQEWWHFTYREEPYPDTYFDVPVSPEALRARRTG